MKNFNKSKYIGGNIAMWVAVLVLVGASLFGIVKLAEKKDNSPTNGNTVSFSVTEDDHKKGNPNAPVTIIEYSDFQCPACASYFPIINKLSEEMGDDLQVVYRHFPLPQHKNAKLAAMVSEAAAKQGKFWEAHDMIFENQSEWSESKKAEELFLEYIDELNLDPEKFSQDLGSSESQNKINNAFIEGTKAGINSTPTFFINGEKVSNPRNYEEFKKVIEQKISDSLQLSQ